MRKKERELNNKLTETKRKVTDYKRQMDRIIELNNKLQNKAQFNDDIDQQLCNLNLGYKENIHQYIEKIDSLQEENRK